MIRKLNILLVEDSEADVKIAVRAFEKASIINNLSIVTEGEEAFNYLLRVGKYRDEKAYPLVNIILLDLNLPRMNGLEIIKKLKGDTNLKLIPVVILSSSRNEQDIKESYRLGASGYIHKPVNYSDFIKVVDIFNSYWNLIINLP